MGKNVSHLVPCLVNMGNWPKDMTTKNKKNFSNDISKPPSILVDIFKPLNDISVILFQVQVREIGLPKNSHKENIFPNSIIYGSK